MMAMGVRFWIVVLEGEWEFVLLLLLAGVYGELVDG